MSGIVCIMSFRTLAVGRGRRHDVLVDHSSLGRMLMLPWSAYLVGRIEHRIIDSAVLRDNPLGDPHKRPVVVYVPPGYDDDPDRQYPSVYVIQGYTGQVGMWFNRT